MASILDRWNQLVDYLHAARLVPGPGVRISRMPAGTVISAAAVSRGGSVAAVHTPAGPFDVLVFDDGDGGAPVWKVRLHNSANIKSTTAGMVTIGSHRRMFDVQTWDAKAGVVYLEITYDDAAESYTVTAALEGSLPKTTDEKRYVLRLADIVHDSDTERYTASQIRPVGDVEVLGRWVK